MAVKGLVRVLESCLARESSPLEKVVTNLCTFACSHPEQTPQVQAGRGIYNAKYYVGGEGERGGGEICRWGKKVK